MCLSGHCFCKEGLAGSGRTYQQAALGKFRTDVCVFLRMLQEFDRLLKRFLCFVLSCNILEGHAGLGLHVHLCAALADAHHASRAGHPAEHDAHQDPDQDQRRKTQHDIQDQAGCIIRNLFLELYIGAVETFYQSRIVDPSGIILHLDPLIRQPLVLCHDRELVLIDRHGIDQILIQQIQELIIGDLHGRRVIHRPVDNTHENQRHQCHDQKDQYGRVIAVLIGIAVSVVAVVIVHNLLPILSI